MRGRGDVWRVGWWLVVEGGEVGEDDLVDIGAALDMSEADVDWELHRWEGGILRLTDRVGLTARVVGLTLLWLL
jgi:hypothetical protein